MPDFGIPYMGSKRAIAKDIVSIFPKAENFYDLFGGGASITHAMLIHRKRDFENFYFNEIDQQIVDLIKKSINGEFNFDKFKPKFITRDEFFKQKDADPYVRICWSFGNNQFSYLYSPELEKFKKSLHNAIIFNEFDQTAIDFFGHNNFSSGSSISQRRILCRNITNLVRKILKGK
jgi:hypothetical protein